MKPILKTAIALIALTTTATATVTINGQYGQIRDGSGSVVISTTLWAIIYDSDGNGLLPGDLGENESLTVGSIAAAQAHFSGITIGLDSVIAGDQVIAFGTGADAEGVFSPTMALDGIEQNRIYAFYWFPGISTIGTPIPSTFEIGGINETANYIGNGDNFIGMKIPADGALVTTEIGDDFVGGILPTTRFTAIIVPETSTFTLSALGLAALLRRRRK